MCDGSVGASNHVSVNKMDLVDRDQATFDRIHEEFNSFATGLKIPDLEVISISVLKGDNVVNRSDNMRWLEPDGDRYRRESLVDVPIEHINALDLADHVEGSTSTSPPGLRTPPVIRPA
jgi:sulfate adenylyltransferase subunit 1 (EFTu-like GTPase family)